MLKRNPLATPAPPATPSYSSSPIQMPTVIPSKSETAPSAFEKLAVSRSYFVSKEQADKLDGFDRAFSEADRDKDGKLTPESLSWRGPSIPARPSTRSRV